MSLQKELDKILPGADKVVFHSVIRTYLQKVNPFRLKEMLVWGNLNWGFRCQAVENNEVYGHEFKIDIGNETLTPVG